MKPPLPASVKEKIALSKRKGEDISELIRPYSLKGEDLSGTVIETIDIPEEDISCCSFANAKLGKEGKITNWCRVVARNCSFRGTKFLGTFWMRRADMRNSSFNNASVANVDYRFGDFRGCEFCYATFMVGTDKALGSQFDASLFKDMAKQWNLGILPMSEYEKYLKWKSEHEYHD